MDKQITKETRLESYIQRPNRQQAILNSIEGQMTARQIAIKMGFADLNAVKPRLVELRKQGKVIVVGKAFDCTTKRNVALYEVSK